MVNRLQPSSPFSLALLLPLLLMLLQPATAHAQDTLDAQVDRKTMHEDQTLTLTVTGKMPVSINLDMMFNLNDLELPSPDIEPLKKDFKILGNHQKYSVRSVNGDTTAIITWTYELAPQTTGTLTIPPLTFKNSTSEPVNVEVESGHAPKATGTVSPAFVEVSADKSDAYVQEQVIVTVKLFYRGNLIRGDLSEPDPGDAIMETMGEQKEYARVRDNTSYRVVERRYALYPQSPGTLELSGIQFKGQARDASNQLKFLRDQADTLRIPIKDIPDSFTGDTWLPAASLELSQSWSDKAKTLKTGQSIERTIKLNALGLLASALPPMKIQYPENKLRSYPDQPDMDSTVNNRTVTSTRAQSTSLVAVKPGNVQLSEIRVPWWDTVNDRQRVAVIPAQTFTITGKGTNVAQPAAPANGTGGDSGGTPNPPPQPTGSDDNSGSTTPTDSGISIWFWVALVLGLGWSVSFLIWWRKRGGSQSLTAAPRNAREDGLFQELISHAASGDSATLDLLPRWARLRFDRSDLHSVSDVLSFRNDPKLNNAIHELQQRLFASKSSTETWSGGLLIERLKALREKTATQSNAGLNPLYPEGLGAR